MNDPRWHIPVRKMAEYVTGELSLLKRVDIESHLAICPRCAGSLAEMERIITGIRADIDGVAPVSITDGAVEKFRSKKSRRLTSSDLFQHVLAVLHFDSAGLAPVFGVRSGEPGPRQLLFSAGTNDVDLRIEPLNHDWSVSGQILGNSDTGGSAYLLGAKRTSAAVLNELSEFLFKPVEAGTYRLLVKLADIEIETGEIRIGS